MYFTAAGTAQARTLACKLLERGAVGQKHEAAGDWAPVADSPVRTLRGSDRAQQTTCIGEDRRMKRSPRIMCHAYLFLFAVKSSTTIWLGR
jgi:hypothetical protein